MNDQDKGPQPESTPPPPAEQAPVAPPAAGSDTDVEEGKTFAILSYALTFIGLPFFLVPLIMRNNEFSLYHAKQCLLLWLAGLAVSIVGSILIAVCVGLVLLPVGIILLCVLDIMGLINAINGKMQPVPLIGKYAEEWFKGLRKV